MTLCFKFFKKSFQVEDLKWKQVEKLNALDRWNRKCIHSKQIFYIIIVNIIISLTLVSKTKFKKFQEIQWILSSKRNNSEKSFVFKSIQLKNQENNKYQLRNIIKIKSIILKDNQWCVENFVSNIPIRFFVLFISISYSWIIFFIWINHCFW